MGKLKHWMTISLLCLLVAAIWGLLLRWVFVGGPLGFRYHFFLHAHSHTATLGWGYLAMFTLFVHFFLDEYKAAKKYTALFYGAFLSVLAMLVSFSMTGYSVISTVFSTIHILFAYTFAGFLIRDRNKITAGPAKTFLFTALGFLVFSSFGIWFLAYVFASGIGSSIWYYIAIHFYLHFQFHGWFGMGIFAVFFKWTNNANWQLNHKKVKWFYLLFTASVICNFSMVLFWGFKTQHYFIVHVLGVLLQLAATVILIELLWKDRKKINLIQSNVAKYLLVFSFMAFLTKNLIQLFTLVPDWALVAITVRNFSIGFFHLFLLGVLTLFLIGMAGYRLINLNNKLGLWSLILLVSGIVLSEIMIFGQGILLWMNIGHLEYYYLLVFISSGLIVLGAAGFFILSLKSKMQLK